MAEQPQPPTALTGRSIVFSSINGCHFKIEKSQNLNVLKGRDGVDYVGDAGYIESRHEEKTAKAFEAEFSKKGLAGLRI